LIWNDFPIDSGRSRIWSYRVTAYKDTAGLLEKSYSNTVLCGYPHLVEFPTIATRPYPKNNTINQPLDIELSWMRGDHARSHDIYFGFLASNMRFVGNQTEASYLLETLSPETTYYWRIDTVHSEGVIKGDEWSFTTTSETPPPKILFVNDDALGGDGSSWAEAFKDLQDALDVAVSGDQIWVAAGNYTPTAPNGDRTISFELKNGVEIYGGFPEKGDWENRDPELYETILSGDLNNNDDPFTAGTAKDNSFHVVNGSNTDATAVLDGFTIIAGNANGDYHPANKGGGMYNNSGSPTVSNCTFYRNSAVGHRGGGMFNMTGSSPTVSECEFIENQSGDGGGMTNENNCNPIVTNCLFIDNQSLSNPWGSGSGGGMHNRVSSSPTIINCSFVNNNSSSYKGGGLVNYDSSNPILIDCTFSGNTSAVNGGGIYNSTGCFLTIMNCSFLGNSAVSAGGGVFNWNNCVAELTNCLFSGNSAKYGGGYFDDNASNSTITNCTFTLNSAANKGGGLRIHDDSSLSLVNSIVWGNTAPQGPQIGLISNGSVSISYCDVQGGKSMMSVENSSIIDWSAGNIDTDPLFVDAAGRDLRLSYGSPCIDAGNNDAVPQDYLDLDEDGNLTELIPWDLGGNFRQIDEYSRDTGIGLAPIVDMGAYEAGGLEIPVIDYITITGPVEVDENSGTQYACTATYSNGSSEDIANNVNWDVNSDFASIDNDGYLTTSEINSDQSCTITASFNGKIDMHELTIIDTDVHSDSLTVISPVSNELWAKSQTYQIEWITGNPSANVKIQLFRGDVKVMGIKNPTANDGVHSWKIPKTLPNGNPLPKGTNYRIKVTCLADSSVCGFSDMFEICGPCDLYIPMTVSEPGNSKVWEMGKTYSIQWTGGEIEQDVKVLLFKGSTRVKIIEESTANNGQFDFTVPYNLQPGSNYRIKVKVLGRDCSSLKDFSDYFIIKIPPIKVTEPTGSTNWMRGQTHQINWTGGKPSKSVKINLLKAGAKVRTIVPSTPNDGTFNWPAPNNLALGSDYQVKIVYLPNTALKDLSTNFRVIGSEPDEPDFPHEPLATPQNLNATQGESVDEIKLTWDTVYGADSYNIYQYDDANVGYRKIGNTGFVDYNWRNVSCPVTEVPQMIYLFYKISAVDAEGNEGPLSEHAVGWACSNLPQNVTASQGMYSDKIFLNWDPVPGAQWYGIYESTTGPDGDYTRLDNEDIRIEQSQVNITQIANDDHRYYKITSFINGQESQPSTVVEGWINAQISTDSQPPNLPEWVLVNGVTLEMAGCMEVRWDKVENAVAYKIYIQKTEANQAPVWLATVEQKPYTQGINHHSNGTVYYADDSSVTDYSRYQLKEMKTYRYYITAVNQYGESMAESDSGYFVNWNWEY
jgi:fibronectin type 3 domain-containing protein/5-hydroxyisourate hydrolase-like protein (transthyretin family)